MTYFTTTYRPGNPNQQVPSAGTAIYIGPNPPPAHGGTPFTFTPPAPGESVGSAVLPCFSWGVTGEPSPSAVTVPMSQAEYEGLGNILYVAHHEATQTIVHVCTGGVVAMTYGTDWAGVQTLCANAPASANFAEWFVQHASYLIANPLPNVGGDDDYEYDDVVITIIAGVVLVGGGGWAVIGIGAFLFFIDPSPIGGGSSFAGSVVQKNGSLSPPIHTTIPANGKWGDGCVFLSSFTDPITPHYNYLTGTW